MCLLLFDGGLFDFDVYFRVLVLILLCFGFVYYVLVTWLVMVTYLGFGCFGVWLLLVLGGVAFVVLLLVWL